LRQKTPALETGDAAYIAKAMGVVARAKGMTELSSAGEMFHPERAGNYDGDLSTRDVERLLMGPEPA